LIIFLGGGFVGQDSKGHPQLGRDLQQIELFSEELKDKVQGAIVTSDLNAATRFLAEQGVNGRRSGKPHLKLLASISMPNCLT
jgi:hypothetical protein